MKFINWELKQVGHKEYPWSRAIDTLDIARRKFPGSPNTLDALCKRFTIDNSNRVKHGALLDAELLAEVYLELMGGRQRGLVLDVVKATSKMTSKVDVSFREARPHGASEEELKRHAQFVVDLGEDALWNKTQGK